MGFFALNRDDEQAVEVENLLWSFPVLFYYNSILTSVDFESNTCIPFGDIFFPGILSGN